MSPTPRAAVLAGALALLVLVLPVPLVLAIEASLLVAVALDALTVRTPPELQRSLSSILSRGLPARLELVPGPVRGRLRIRQPATPDVRVVPAEADGMLDAAVVALRRGRHELPAPATRVVGPLGLGSWQHRPGEPVELVVYPDLPAARRLALAVRRGRFRLEGRRRGPLGLGTEFESVREYAPDDDLRHVNWRATQRLGRPMSNQYRLERDQDAICLLDCGRLMAAPLGDRTRLDAAVDAAVAVAAVADELGDRVGAIAFEREVRRVVQPRRRGSRAVVTALFDLEPVSVDSNYELAFARVADAKRAFVFVFTDLLEEGAARPLLGAMPLLARRHAVTIVSASDRDLEELTTTEPADAPAVFRAAVALDVLEARTAVMARLRRTGAQVIEAPPERLATACVRAYLTAKSRARV